MESKTLNAYELMSEIKDKLGHKIYNDFCETNFGIPFLEKWNSTRTIHCNNGTTEFDCLDDIRNLRPFRPPTAGAYQCSGRNVYLQLVHMQNLSYCVPHRPSVKCSAPLKFHDLKPGSFTGDCLRDSFMKNITNFSVDHLQNFIHGWEEVGNVIKPSTIIDKDLLLVSRENWEYLNPYHTFTDLLNAFVVMYLNKLNTSNTLLLFFDEHGKSPFDPIWQKAFSGGGKFIHISSFSHDTVIYAKSINIVPAGYINWIHRAKFLPCNWEVSIFEGFRRYIHSWMKIEKWAEQISNGIKYSNYHKNSTKYITIINRKPYDIEVNKLYLPRQFDNEIEILDKLQLAFPNTIVRLVDYVPLKIESQIALSEKTDLLIGIHGAALAFSLFSNNKGGLIEIAPEGNEWHCFNGISSSRNMSYFRVKNVTKIDDYKNKVNPETLIDVIKNNFPMFD